VGKQIYCKQASCGFTTSVQGVCSRMSLRVFIPVCVCVCVCVSSYVCVYVQMRAPEVEEVEYCWEYLGALSWNRSQQALACQPVLYVHIQSHNIPQS